MNTVTRLFLSLCVLFLLLPATGCRQETTALQVNDVVSDPGAFNGPMSVVGITYGYSQADPTVVGIMDVKELQCTTPNCKKVLLPVKVQGKVPAIGDEVKISGTFSKEPAGYLFIADEVQVLASHDLGRQG